MFQFNFSNSHAIECEEDKNPKSKKFKAEEKIVPCKFLTIPEDVDLEVPDEILKLATFGDISIKYLTQKAIENEVNECGLLADGVSDLLPGKYEGGFKVWECSLDLANYITQNECIRSGYDVLELGCGIGLPGIVSYLCDAKVTFQDYNCEVLDMVTIVNVCLNAKLGDLEDVKNKCRFLSGDWGCIQKKYYNSHNEDHCKKFDVILTSETIYDESNYINLLELIKATLKPKGNIYLSAKVHYFGVGGGIHNFIEIVEKDGTFKYDTVFRADDGVERRILKLYFKDKNKIDVQT